MGKNIDINENRVRLQQPLSFRNNERQSELLLWQNLSLGKAAQGNGSALLWSFTGMTLPSVQDGVCDWPIAEVPSWEAGGWANHKLAAQVTC